MINLENPITTVIGGVGALFGIFGILLHFFPPKNINYAYGYRTVRAMKDQQSWDYAQKSGGKWMAVVGALFFIIGIIAAFIIKKPLPVSSVALLLGLLIGGCIFMVMKVERELKYKFDATFSKDEKTFNTSILLAPLIPLMISALIMWATGRENKVVIQKDYIEIQHTYGETIPFSNIKNIELVNRLPKIKRRKNGSVGANTLKGNFETYTGNIKLILNGKKNRPFLKIEKHEGETVYFSYKEDSVEPILLELKQKINL